MIDHAQANAVALREVAFRAAIQPEYALAGLCVGGVWMVSDGVVMQYAWPGDKYPIPKFPTWTGLATRPASTVVSFAGCTFGDGAWWFAPEKIGQGGVSEGINRDAIQHTAYASGAFVGPMPNAPTRLTVAQTTAAKYRLSWLYNPTDEQIAPTEFVIFGDGGTGTIDFASPLGTVTYTPPRQWYTWLSGVFAGGTERKFLVLARVGSVYSLTVLAGSDPNEFSEDYFDQASPVPSRLVGGVIVTSEPTAPPAPEVV